MDERATDVERLGAAGGTVVIRDAGRRFPGLLIQGDTMQTLLQDLEEEAPDSVACQRVREWLTGYERVMSSLGLELPYLH
jgi:hypothetical protein